MNEKDQQYIMDNIYIILKFHQILSMKLGSATISLIRIFQIYFNEAKTEDPRLSHKSKT